MKRYIAAYSILCAGAINPLLAQAPNLASPTASLDAPMPQPGSLKGLNDTNSGCITLSSDTGNSSANIKAYKLDECGNGSCNEYINCMVTKLNNEMSLLSDTSYASGLTNASKMATAASSNLNNYIGACFQTGPAPKKPGQVTVMQSTTCTDGVGITAQASSAPPWAPFYFPSGSGSLTAALRSGIDSIRFTNQALAITQVLRKELGDQAIADIATNIVAASSTAANTTYTTSSLTGNAGALSTVIFNITKALSQEPQPFSDGPSLRTYLIKNQWLRGDTYAWLSPETQSLRSAAAGSANDTDNFTDDATAAHGKKVATRTKKERSESSTAQEKDTMQRVKQLDTALDTAFKNPQSITLSWSKESGTGWWQQPFTATYPTSDIQQFKPSSCDAYAPVCNNVLNTALTQINNGQSGIINFTPPTVNLPQTLGQLDDNLQIYSCCLMLAQKQSYYQAACVKDNWQTVVSQINTGNVNLDDPSATIPPVTSTMPVKLDPFSKKSVDFTNPHSYELIALDPDENGNTANSKIFFPILKDWVQCNYTNTSEQFQCLAGAQLYPPTGIGPNINAVMNALAPAKTALQTYVGFLQALKQGQGQSFAQEQCLNTAGTQGKLNIINDAIMGGMALGMLAGGIGFALKAPELLKKIREWRTGQTSGESETVEPPVNQKTASTQTLNEECKPPSCTRSIEEASLKAAQASTTGKSLSADELVQAVQDGVAAAANPSSETPPPPAAIEESGESNFSENPPAEYSESSSQTDSTTPEELTPTPEGGESGATPIAPELSTTPAPEPIPGTTPTPEPGQTPMADESFIEPTTSEPLEPLEPAM